MWWGWFNSTVRGFSFCYLNEANIGRNMEKGVQYITDIYKYIRDIYDISRIYEHCLCRIKKICGFKVSTKSFISLIIYPF